MFECRVILDGSLSVKKRLKFTTEFECRVILDGSLSSKAKCGVRGKKTLKEKEWCNMGKNKRFSISISDEMNKTLKKAQDFLFPQLSINKTIVELIQLGLEVEKTKKQNDFDLDNKIIKLKHHS